MISIKNETITTSTTSVDEEDKMKCNSQESFNKFHSSYSIESLKRKTPSPMEDSQLQNDTSLSTGIRMVSSTMRPAFPYPFSALTPQAVYFANMANHMINSLAQQQQQYGKTLRKQDINNNEQNQGSDNESYSNGSNGLVCIVCGDVSSGKHYGILACNGCSGFFKRSVRRKLIYRCQAGTGTCVIDKAHRNQCQACRLKKCIKMGMNKDAVQNERQPRNSSQVKADSIAEYLKDSSTVSIMHPINSRNNRLESTSDEDEQPKTKRLVTKKHSNDIEQDLSSSSDDSGSSAVKSPILEPVHELSMRMLFMSIKWCKTLPSFLSLPSKDQISLLENTWSDIFLLCALQWSLYQDPNPFLACNNESINELVLKFKQLNVDSSEFAFLKAIVLFKPEIKGLKETVSIEILQDQAQIMLAQYVANNNTTQIQQQQTGRFGKLLLTISMLKSLTPKTIEKLYFPTHEFSMDKFLHDLIRN